MATFEEHLEREALLAKTPLWGNSYTIKSSVFRFVETREQKFEKGDETNPPRMSNVVTRFLVVEKPDSEKTQQFFVGDDFYDATNNTIHVYAPILKKTQKKLEIVWHCADDEILVRSYKKKVSVADWKLRSSHFAGRIKSGV